MTQYNAGDYVEVTIKGTAAENPSWDARVELAVNTDDNIYYFYRDKKSSWEVTASKPNLKPGRIYEDKDGDRYLYYADYLWGIKNEAHVKDELYMRLDPDDPHDINKAYGPLKEVYSDE